MGFERGRENVELAIKFGLLIGPGRGSRRPRECLDGWDQSARLAQAQLLHYLADSKSGWIHSRAHVLVGASSPKGARRYASEVAWEIQLCVAGVYEDRSASAERPGEQTSFEDHIVTS
jgi:hypothetical protein